MQNPFTKNFWYFGKSSSVLTALIIIVLFFRNFEDSDDELREALVESLEQVILPKEEILNDEVKTEEICLEEQKSREKQNFPNSPEEKVQKEDMLQEEKNEAIPIKIPLTTGANLQNNSASSRICAVE